MKVAPATIGVFDAGIGGMPIAACLAEGGHRVVYLGDSGRRPYGPQPNHVVAGYVAEAEQFFAESGCDLWVIACNTASVVTPMAVRGLLPCVDMVSAVVHRYPAGRSGPLGLLATTGTVASGAYLVALDGFDVQQVATEELLRLAEEGSGDHAAIRDLAAETFSLLRDQGCTEVVLACTDFTCVISDLKAEAAGLVLVDPIEAVLELVDERVSELGNRRAPHGLGHRLMLTGPHPVDVPRYAWDHFGLLLPQPEFLALEPVSSSKVLMTNQHPCTPPEGNLS